MVRSGVTDGLDDLVSALLPYRTLGVFVVAVEVIADRLFAIFPFASVHVLVVSWHCRVDDFDELQELGAAMAPLELGLQGPCRCDVQRSK